MKILIIEDDRAASETLVWNLRKIGFEDVEVCSWGSEKSNPKEMPSLEFIGGRIEVSDLIFLDYQLSAPYNGKNIFDRFCSDERKKVLSTSSMSPGYGVSCHKLAEGERLMFHINLLLNPK